MDEQAVRAALRHHLDHSGTDEDMAHEIYHADATLEFPQSGERFEGVHTFREWRRRYPARVSYEVGRVRGSGAVWVAELLVRYDGGEPKFGVDVLEFRDGKVARETIYVADGWPAPDWRAPWRAAPPPPSG
ncbi:nuclear transport factor 2 family protein [Micromonospora soli]|uniref:nuclear transport factor 2 family protein n=1 Tax=Micromonospora sp. NBRC 110009 TaxID=3061627 RepID=UPI002673D024|nr:nuclear transport factor 2 family protein [Micromonospora sp. NBRC 110009]WKT97266.1 nuclear transport factor 2 family protein [Micromonospora sp. NBRC 110009]